MTGLLEKKEKKWSELCPKLLCSPTFFFFIFFQLLRAQAIGISLFTQETPPFYFT